MFDKKQKSCGKRIHLVTDNNSYAWKAFYNIKLVLIHPFSLRSPSTF